jgi:hypothetical protein
MPIRIAKIALEPITHTFSRYLLFDSLTVFKNTLFSQVACKPAMHKRPRATTKEAVSLAKTHGQEPAKVQQLSSAALPVLEEIERELRKS